MILFACLEVARLMYSYNALTEVSRRAARLAAARAFSVLVSRRRRSVPARAGAKSVSIGIRSLRWLTEDIALGPPG